MSRNGTYKVIVTYKGTTTAQTTFNFNAGTQGQQAWKTYTLNAGGQSYPIQYIITNGTVAGMSVDQKTSTLVINVSTTGNGNLQLKLPRNVIDSRQGTDGKSGADTPFAVFLDEAENVDADESTPTADMRQISFDLSAGTQKVEIVGTTAVPEFGALAAIVLGAAIVGIIVATARYNNKFNFPRL
jgi:predicted secreted protein with PEFG-CTERM motif